MKTKFFLIVYFLLLIAASVYSQTDKLAFVQNKGQWDGDITYKTDFPGGQALATSTGMLVGLFDNNSILERSAWVMQAEDRFTGAQYLLNNPLPPAIKGHGWKFHFLNGNPSPAITNKGQNLDFYNYWLGNESQQASKVRSFEEIIYKEVYTNIDVRYYTSPKGDLENDIILKPYADAANLAFELEGIDQITQNSQGDLILTTSIGDVNVPAPISYLIDSKGIKTPITVQFLLDNKTIRFIIPSYDASQTLVIDPVVLRWASWATNSASSVSTHNHATSVDASGNIYTTGLISSAGLITVGAFQETAGGGMDLFIGKYTEPTTPGGTGTRVWQTYFGGARVDDNAALQIGADGFMYMAANTYSNIQKTYGTGFTAGSWTQRTGNSGTFGQALIVKLDLAGNGAMTREIGSCTMDFSFRASDIRTLKTGASSNDLIFSGSLRQPASLGVANGDFPAPQAPNGTFYTQPATSTVNAVIMRLSSDFTTLNFIKNIGSDITSAKDEAVTITTIDYAGNIYAAGYTKASDNISYNNPSTQIALTGTQDGWIMKLNSSGAVQWSRYFNSKAASTTTILSLELNTNDLNLTIAGTTNGLATSNITSGAAQTIYGGGTADLFVANISKSGSTTNWGTYFGGSSTETNMMGLNVDKNNDVYFLGYTSSTNYPVTTNAIQATNFGSNDAVFTKLSANGATIQYSTYYGGSNDDNDPVGQRGVVFNNCRIYLSLSASSNNIPLTAGAITTTKASAAGVSEPVLVSLGNPPDLNNATISASQTLSCGQTPSALTAGVASYNIATIIRNGSTQTNGTAGAYPTGVPTPSGYQWQKSVNYGYSWTSIAGATAQNYSPAALTQTTFFRRIVSGDYCTNTDSTVCITVSGAPTVSPTATCTSTTASFFANASGGSSSNTYEWTGPLAFTSTLANPQILAATTEVNGYYSVTVSDIGGCKNTKVVFLDFGSCTYSVILSVSLVSFRAEKAGTTAKLNWQTANEHNSDAFIIERSNEGSEWVTLGTQKAAGNSYRTIGYTFVDAAPTAGHNYYRLKILDLDGTYKYSEVRALLFAKQNSAALVNMLPNPCTNSMTINYELPANGPVAITVNDAQGRVLASVEAYSQKGENSTVLNTSTYSSGIYFVNVNYMNINSNYKMVVKR